MTGTSACRADLMWSSGQTWLKRVFMVLCMQLLLTHSASATLVSCNDILFADAPSSFEIVTIVIPKTQLVITLVFRVKLSLPLRPKSHRSSVCPDRGGFRPSPPVLLGCHVIPAELRCIITVRQIKHRKCLGIRMLDVCAWIFTEPLWFETRIDSCKLAASCYNQLFLPSQLPIH